MRTRIYSWCRRAVFSRISLEVIDMRSQKKSLNQISYICGLVILTIFCSANIQAQNIFGRISGTITDQAGAVVPNIKITIVNEATKAARMVTTDADGFYLVDNLPVGSYSVTAEQSGFKKTYSSGVGLVAGAH